MRDFMNVAVSLGIKCESNVSSDNKSIYNLDELTIL